MTHLCVAPIVEGHGEVESVRGLLERIWYEVIEGEHISVLRPIRRPRSKLLERSELVRALKLSELQLGEHEGGGAQVVLLLLDANGDPPCTLGPEMVSMAEEEMAHLDFACVLANPEYETWFVAAAESLEPYFESVSRVPGDPEASGSKKAWIKRHKIGKYSETVDQPAMTAKMDLSLCRQRSASFDKLCRELEKRVGQ